MPDGDVIEYLVAHGAYVEAARIAAERGETARAIQLYERVWRFADAVPLALALGDRGLAVRLALDANLPDRATDIADAAGPADLPAIADAFAARGRPFEAARAAERAGDGLRAASLYRRAAAPLDEARARARAGDLREAGLVYERVIAEGSPDEAPRARLALGRLLGRLGRHEDAARQLQTAAQAPAARAEALRALVGPLLALGFRGAAAEVATRLRQEDASLPSTLEELAAVDEAEATAGDVAGPGPGATPSRPGFRRFAVKRAIGAGAVGRVYEAVDLLLGVPVALKLLTLGGTGGEPERQAYLRFAREAEAAGRLRHPNIVALHDAQAASGLFVFELMSSGTLAERLAAGGPLSPPAGRRLALDLLAALGAAHEHGIVHRDVKPANVLYDAAGNAKLGDFGGAHLADFGQTQTGGFLGTLAYMSPEQITGAPIGFSADLYALGATLFEALTGRPPFLGPDLVAQHLGEAPPAPSALRPALGPAHDEVLRRALAKAPDERFASAAEMAIAVAAWPVEAAAVPGTGASAPASALGAQPVAEALRAGDGAAEERELWRTDDRRVVLRYDRRTERDVLVEERAAPLDEAGLERVRRLAAAGGPFVQRVLRLDADGRSISYESIEGEARPLAALTPAERRQLAAPLAALTPAAARAFARTPAGPVLLVVAPPDEDG
jgi:serine/threonine-protein kinase